MKLTTIKGGIFLGHFFSKTHRRVAKSRTKRTEERRVENSFKKTATNCSYKTSGVVTVQSHRVGFLWGFAVKIPWDFTSTSWSYF